MTLNTRTELTSLISKKGRALREARDSFASQSIVGGYRPLNEIVNEINREYSLKVEIAEREFNHYSDLLKKEYQKIN